MLKRIIKTNLAQTDWAVISQEYKQHMGAILEGERDNILKDLSEVTLDNELDVHEEEDIEEEFVVHDDDSTDSDDDDNIPLARFQWCSNSFDKIIVYFPSTKSCLFVIIASIQIMTSLD